MLETQAHEPQVAEHECRWVPPWGYRPKDTTFRWCPECGEVRWEV